MDEPTPMASLASSASSAPNARYLKPTTLQCQDAKPGRRSNGAKENSPNEVKEALPWLKEQQMSKS
jgi:hypothetical protein